MENIAQIIAEEVNKINGKAYYVGGFVRDKILGIESKDIDIEVHNIEPKLLFDILSKIGEPITIGSSFGIYSLKGLDIDIALPRKERKNGFGHRDFEVFVDPYIGVTEASRRRDFTINSIYEDILTGEILDPFNGRDDIGKGIIRHIDDETFIEDPLRVLRAAQFASRFEFEIASETIDLCKKIDIKALSKERVEIELRKVFLKGKKPSIFFNELKRMDQLNIWFPELIKLIGLEQDKIFHPEGDVFTHTMEVIDRGSKYLDKVSDPFSFMLLCLTHDFGKVDTTEVINGRIHSYSHEIAGLPMIKQFLKRITNENDTIHYVLNMVPLHMKPNIAINVKPKLKSTNRMFDEAVAPMDLIYFALSDKPPKCDVPFLGDIDFLFERLDKYMEIMSRPYVTGKDLIDNGISPNPHFSDILSYSHKLRLAGIDKESALKQTLTYVRSKYDKSSNI